MKNVQIPSSKLEEGIELCKEQTKMSLESSEILLKKRKYVSSIGLSILAKEELTKIRIFRRMQKYDKPIENDLWRILNDHKEKLGLPHILQYHSLKKQTPLDIVKMREFFFNSGIDPKVNVVDLVQPLDVRGIKFFQSLDLLKQDCHFLNWIDGDWYSVLNNYDLNTQKSIAHTIYNYALQDYLSILLSLKYKKGDKPEIPKTRIGNKYKKIVKYTRTKEFEKMSDFAFRRIFQDYEKRHQEVLKDARKRKKPKVEIPF